MAVYYEDGVQYRAKILQVKSWKKAAVVKFLDYGNEEEVKMSDMFKKLVLLVLNQNQW